MPYSLLSTKYLQISWPTLSPRITPSHLQIPCPILSLAQNTFWYHGLLSLPYHHLISSSNIIPYSLSTRITPSHLQISCHTLSPTLFPTSPYPIKDDKKYPQHALGWQTLHPTPPYPIKDNKPSTPIPSHLLTYSLPPPWPRMTNS